MFTYLDPKIRQQLIEQGKFIRIDQQGKRIDSNAEINEHGEINLLGPIELPLNMGGLQTTARWYAAVRRSQLKDTHALADKLSKNDTKTLFAEMAPYMSVNSVLIFGDPQKNAAPLVRVHSNCLTGDIFGSERCECGPQLHNAASRMQNDPQGGILIYMAGHEGRGIGLWAKAATYILQDAGEDTYQANMSLGLPVDSRNFEDAATLIHYFVGNRPFRLLTNNPKKIADLQQHGLNQFITEKHVHGINHQNERYLRAKRQHGHIIGDDDLAP